VCPPWARQRQRDLIPSLSPLSLTCTTAATYNSIMGIPAEVLTRIGEAKDLEGLSPEELMAVVKEYYDKWIAKEDEKYDLEYSVKLRDLQIQELEMEVSDMRGKFILPKLKKVHAFKLMNEES